MGRPEQLMRIIILAIMAVGLSGCFLTPQGQVKTLEPVCDALIGPIKYNSTKPSSRVHAGPDLAPELKRRNQVGVNLHCPGYE